MDCRLATSEVHPLSGSEGRDRLLFVSPHGGFQGKSRAEQAPNECTYFARVVPSAFRRSVPFGADMFTCGVEGDSQKRCVSNA